MKKSYTVARAPALEVTVARAVAVGAGTVVPKVESTGAAVGVVHKVESYLLASGASLVAKVDHVDKGDSLGA